MRALAVLAGVAAVSVLLLPGPSTPAANTAAREIVFVRGEPSLTEIYVIREDGRRLRRVTNNRFSDYYPSWSPDGDRILFVSNRDGDDELYLMDARGLNVRQLTRNRAQDTTPQWSPDGRFIAFTSDRQRAGEPEIWVMRSDGSDARRLVSTVNHPTWQDAQYSPTWSPDGRRLIFSMAVADSNPELFVVGVDGKGLRRLTRTAGSVDVLGDDSMPDWSSDGKTVVFVSNREGISSDVWTMSPNGAGQRPVVRRARSDDWSPRLSPDGRTIAYVSYPAGGGAPSVWVMRRDGSGARLVTAGVEPDWRP